MSGDVPVPAHARCVVIGGGLAGTSIAYHLTQLGWRDVLLLERHELTSGSTFHSAGFVGQLRASLSLTRMMMYSVELYRRLEREAPEPPGWREVGGVRLASSAERLEELRRQAAWAKTFGLSLELISAAEARDRFPLLDTDGVLGASFLPTDGYIDPSKLCRALAAAAQRGGCRILTGRRVIGIDVERGRVRRVRTDAGPVETEVVVNAGGIHAAAIGRLAGVRIPVVPLLHQYVVTEPVMGPDDPGERLPTLRDLDGLIYARPEQLGLAMGGYHADATPWAFDANQLDAIPDNFNFQVLEADWRRFAPLLESAKRRIPAFRSARFTKLVNGPEAFTPDGEFCLGETPVRGFYVAAGFCAHGVAGSGGVGKVMAEWIAAGEPQTDLWSMDIRRFGAHFASPAYTLARANEVYETYYSIAYPGLERTAGRPLHLSPAYPWHVKQRASFGEKAGWERVNFYESNAAMGDESLRPRGWAGRYWSPAVGAEHAATRNRVALFDESSFAKIEVSGPGAAAFLERMCANRVAGRVGRVVYTPLLNGRGGIEADVTVSRASPDRFWIITGTAFGTHDLQWLRDHLPDDGSVTLTDMTATYACFALWGPRARAVLEPLTTADVSNAAFPYMTRAAITIGAIPVEAFRVTYVGELGWELYSPAQSGLALWRALWAAGEPHGIVAGGYRAIDSLRVEKGYRVWGADITPDTTPDEAGLGFAVRLDKGDFVGRDALVAARAQGAHRRLCCLTLADPRAVALGNEPVRIGGRVVGRVTSGGFGYSVQRSIAYAYLPTEQATPGTPVEVDIFGEWIAAMVAAEPLFDPKGERVRG